MYYSYTISSDMDSDDNWDQAIPCENDLLLMKQEQMEAWNLETCESQSTKQKNPLNEWKKERMLVRCSHCKCKVTTQVTITHGNLAHKLALLLFFLTFGVGVWLPYCFSSLRYITHRCPLCSAILDVNLKISINALAKLSVLQLPLLPL